jgi:SAM-dependent methyltransferase
MLPIPDPHQDDRTRKAEKIQAILKDFLGQDLSQFYCLDVGCGEGVISNYLAPDFNETVGVDINLYRPVNNDDAIGVKDSKAHFSIASGRKLPISDNSFDIVICSQVYEHVIDQIGLAKEIERVLKMGGVCFFSGPNRLAIIEEHYWLPFLSWLPRKLSNLYMRLFKRGDFYDAYPLFYWQIRSLWASFEIHDYNIDMLRDPNRYFVSERVNKYSWLEYLPDWVLRFIMPLYPNYNWILVKKG